jgi:butyrate kinase
MKSNHIIVINPGSTSTKIAVFPFPMENNEALFTKNIVHNTNEFGDWKLIVEQFDVRQKAIQKELEPYLKTGNTKCIVGRGAPLKPLKGGTYTISTQLLDDVRNCNYSNHASNLGALLAASFAKDLNIPSFIADPVTVDEFTDIARISGLPQIQRKCRSHALNMKAHARQAAMDLKIPYETSRLVLVHMGGGISVGAMLGGAIIDVNDALMGMGPFSPDRAGALPLAGVVDLAYSGDYTKDKLIELFSKKSGMMAYLGTGDLITVEEMIAAGDTNAQLIFDAMTYQITKEIGAMITVLASDVHAVVLTGGMANSKRLVTGIKARVGKLANVVSYPGEKEMEALALAGNRVLLGEEETLEY